MPRSGSTLLQNVLAQNPNMYASPTSGVLELLYAARQNFTTLDEFKLKDKGFYDAAWLSFCAGGLGGFYAGLTDKPVVADKSRGWIYYYDWLKQFYPNPKIIVCVRDIRAVVASMEKMHRKNAHLHDAQDNPATMNFVTIDQRVAHWLSAPPVGLALNRLLDAFQKGNAKNFFFVVYERFMQNPQAVMDDLYRFIEEDPFEHDFSAIAQTVTENDSIHGVYGDHVIRPKLAPLQPDWDAVLGPTICAEIVRRNAWFYNTFYPAAS